jgi:hypothetical protein
VRRFLAEQFQQSGLELHPECNPVEVLKQPNGKLTCVIKCADGSTQQITDNDAVMMATGRVPKTRGLGLQVRVGVLGRGGGEGGWGGGLGRGVGEGGWAPGERGAFGASAAAAAATAAVGEFLQLDGGLVVPACCP